MSAIDVNFESLDLPQPQDVVKVRLKSGQSYIDDGAVDKCHA